MAVLLKMKGIKTKKSCVRAGGVWRKGVPGVRRGSCAKHAKR